MPTPKRSKQDAVPRMLSFALAVVVAGGLVIACDSSPSSVEAPPEPEDDVPTDTTQESTPDPESITASEYVEQIGKGFDVSYAEFGKYIERYNERAVRDFSDAGITNVRIRIGDNLEFDETQDGPRTLTISELKEQVRDALRHDVVPILAYKGLNVEEMDPAPAQQHMVEYWTRIAEEFQGFSNKVSFNILLEITGRYKKDYETINQFYEATYDAIREVDEDRILIFPPVRRSNSEFLKYLEVPGENDPYTMVEWHNYAAGPKRDPSSKKYWNDGTTIEERDYIYEIIDIAERWRAETGYELWYGAWMPGNYNKENAYNIPEQVRFSSFFARQLDEANMPFSVNADHKFYDHETNRWLLADSDKGAIPVVDAFLKPNKIALYSEAGYDGASYRLGPGTYTRDELEDRGLTGDAGSLMVPFDFEVTIYTAESDTALAWTQEDIAGVGDSLKVTDLNSY